VAQILANIAQVLRFMYLYIKDDSTEIVPACSRKMDWPGISLDGLNFAVRHEMKCVGYWITCNGDSRKSRALMLGALRGKLSLMDRRFAGVPQNVRARWWQTHSRGIVGFTAPFLGCSLLLSRQLNVVNSCAARKVLGVGANYHVSSELQRIQSHYKICLHDFSFEV